MNCPAKTQGVIGGCRFCIYIPGGVSDLCVTFIEQRKRMKKVVDPFGDLNPHWRLAGEIWDKLDTEQRIATFKSMGYKNMFEIWMLDPMTMFWDGIAQKRVWYPKLTPIILKLWGKNETV